MIRLPTDFKEFLRSLHNNNVRYLLIGGYAVGHYGYPRATADMDIWISIEQKNSENIVAALIEFGFNSPELSGKLFLQNKQILRIGIAPLRIEILTTISGVEFEECYEKRNTIFIDDIIVSIIGFDDLRKNKISAARPKDIDDLENLFPETSK